MLQSDDGAPVRYPPRSPKNFLLRLVGLGTPSQFKAEVLDQPWAHTTVAYYPTNKAIQLRVLCRPSLGWVGGCHQAAPVGVLAAATICLRQLLQKDTDGAEAGAAAAAAAAASDEGAPSSSSSSSATKSASAPGMGPAPGPASATSGEKKAKKGKVDPKRTNRQR